ncbi:MAG: DHHA1 domain-containing protein, partial [Clostridiales bacterium]|nr:DHHA1 domain-containing protein [Clostridiales bacterium]
QPDAVLLVDCGETKRVSCGWLDTYAALPHYCIDHHVSNDFNGILSVVEPAASSTGEIVAAISVEAGLFINNAAATCLYSAIVNDTGCFRYHNTTPRSLAMAAKLLDQDVDKEQIRIQLFENRSPVAMAMLKTAIHNLNVLGGGELCYTFIRYKDILAHNAAKDDLYNITNYTLIQSGVKIGLFFEEYQDSVKISLRCRQGWRVDRLAKEWGGGGHMLAAGCRISGSLDEVMPLMLQKARGLLITAR